MGASHLSIHDQYQLELKLDYPLGGDRGQAKHTFEVWIYFPGTIGIGDPMFRREDFYDDLVAHVRFQTPKMSFAQLFGDPSAPGAWLGRMDGLLTSGSASAADHDRALRELRLLAAVFRSNVRDETDYLRAHLRNGHQPGVVAEHLEAAGRFVAETSDALARFRALRRAFLDSRTPPRLRDALFAIDDFVSLQALESWFRLLEVIGDGEAGEGARATLQQAIRAETESRVAVGHTGPLDPADALANEVFVTRLNVLKKYVLAPLHLRLATSRRAERLQDLLFGVAAAVAMTIAVLLQLVALWTVGTPSSWVDVGTMGAFVALMVGGYILKDRVKDRLKLWFVSGIPRWLYDRRQDLFIESTGTRIGAVEDTARMVTPGEVPADVARVREHGEDRLFAGLRADEDVVHLRRVITVAGGLARAQAPEVSAVYEILRFNVRRWLRRMDEPVRWLYSLHDDGALELVPGGKAYRVTMILVRRDEGTFEKYSVVLNRKGIVRVESVGRY